VRAREGRRRGFGSSAAACKNATYPGDLAQALVALDAAVEITDLNGFRRLEPFATLHREPGDTPEIETRRCLASLRMRAQRAIRGPRPTALQWCTALSDRNTSSRRSRDAP